MPTYLGRASAYAAQKYYRTGTQTYAEIRIEQANLALARAKKYGMYRATKSHPYKTVTSNPKDRGYKAADRAYKELDINAAMGHPIGDRWMRYNSKGTILRHRPTGRIRKFEKVISPSRFDRRTEWRKASKSGGFRKVLKPRKHRFKNQTHWSRGRVIKPR